MVEAAREGARQVSVCVLFNDHSPPRRVYRFETPPAVTCMSPSSMPAIPTKSSPSSCLERYREEKEAEYRELHVMRRGRYSAALKLIYGEDAVA